MYKYKDSYNLKNFRMITLIAMNDNILLQITVIQKSK